MTQPVVREGPTLFFDEPEPHGFWLAMNWVAFLGCPHAPGKQSTGLFSDPLKSLRVRITRRSCSVSRASLRSLGETASVSGCALPYLVKVDKPTPRSSAICLREITDVSAIRTASLRNSADLTVPMVHPLLHITLTEERTKPRQDQISSAPIPGTTRPMVELGVTGSTSTAAIRKPTAGATSILSRCTGPRPYGFSTGGLQT